MITDEELVEAMVDFKERTQASSKKVNALRMLVEETLGELLNQSTEVRSVGYSKEEFIEAWKLALATYLNGLETYQPTKKETHSNG